MSSDPITKVIPKETICRLLKDVKTIMKHPLTENGIYYIHNDADMLKGYAMIVGPSETPYFGGYYFFELTYPRDYPHTPPMVTYHTNGDNVRFNPNLYKSGKVCVSVLNTWRGEQWTACQTISSVLLVLCTLLCKDPLLNEPGISNKHNDFDDYTEIIVYKNIEIAVLNMINKKTSVYPEQFDIFYSNMKELFLVNQTSILAILNNKKSLPSKDITTRMYSMKYSLNYSKLYDLFLETQKTIV